MHKKNSTHYLIAIYLLIITAGCSGSGRSGNDQSGNIPDNKSVFIASAVTIDVSAQNVTSQAASANSQEASFVLGSGLFAGSFLWYSFSETGMMYHDELHFSELSTGITTVNIPLWSDSFGHLIYMVEQDGLLDSRIEYIKKVNENGGIVLIDLQEMPIWLSSKPENEEGEFWRYPPKDYDTWKLLIAYIVDHLYKNGLHKAHYRIWEEADLDSFWRGTDEEFQKLYKYSVEGIRLIDPDALITFGWASSYNESLLNMMKYIKNNTLPLDYVIFHPFNKEPVIEFYEYKINHLKNWLEQAGLNPDIPVHAESWNSWLEFGRPALPSGEWDERSLERDTEYNSAYIASTLITQYRSGLNYQTFFSDIDWGYWKYRDFLYDPDAQFYGEFGVLTRDLIKKPSFNALKAISILLGKNDNQPLTILQADTDDFLLSVLASKTQISSRIRIILSNFAPQGGMIETIREHYIDRYTDEYISDYYGQGLILFQNCLNEDGTLAECRDLADPELWPFLDCLMNGGGEECWSLYPQHILDHREFLGEKFDNLPEHPRKVEVMINNIPFTGNAELSIYTIDKENSNSCRYNKKTEQGGSGPDLPCGVSGSIDREVKQALGEAVNLANKFPENIRKQITDSLFYYCESAGPSGENLKISTCIDKINNKPEVSLEGSKQSRIINVTNTGSYSEEITMLPSSVVLIEIEK